MKRQAPDNLNRCQFQRCQLSIVNCQLKRGFTLVELLVAIVILTILAGLITAGATAALRSANNFQIKAGLHDIETALEMYKNKYGEYPPDFAGLDSADDAVKNNALNEINRHIQKRWPRYSPDSTSESTLAENFFKDLSGACNIWDFNTSTPNSAVALAFWLGGLPDNDNTGYTRLSGFSADPSNPFNMNAKRQEPVMEIIYEENMRKNENNQPVLVARKMPIVYFRGTSATTDSARRRAYAGQKIVDSSKNYYEPKFTKITIGGVDQYAIPYAVSSNPVVKGSTWVHDLDGNGDPIVQWFNPNSYQLVHPGLDGNFNGTRSAPGGERKDADDNTNYCADMNQNGITPMDIDNVANIGDGATIQASFK
ncbi:MAG TPA: hypothetical protein DEB39_14390 [Planctomycetaceae bacterium]|nr:hypothetical protein [Planctomycetaceae bacterium]